MSDSRQINQQALNDSLSQYGLALRGVGEITQDERQQYGLTASRIALVGNVGADMWGHFSAAAEYHDGLPHPLDRWSRRVAAGVCERFELEAIFPFDGPPYLPFQRWACSAEALEQSPLGLMMHPQYGLWHAYRFALLLPDTSVMLKAQQVASICHSCSDKPCLHTCPVNALTESGYDVPACIRYLEHNVNAACHLHGCMARYRCPQGQTWRYHDAQSQFHLRAFLRANRGAAVRTRLNKNQE
jgi:hypothetical protein